MSGNSLDMGQIGDKPISLPVDSKSTGILTGYYKNIIKTTSNNTFNITCLSALSCLVVVLIVVAINMCNSPGVDILTER